MVVILQAKLRRPSPTANFVERPRLNARLSEGVDTAAILTPLPGGFGALRNGERFWGGVEMTRGGAGLIQSVHKIQLVDQSLNIGQGLLQAREEFHRGGLSGYGMGGFYLGMSALGIRGIEASPYQVMPVGFWSGFGNLKFEGKKGTRWLFRGMKVDNGQTPLSGPTARTLGVRPEIDIPVCAGCVKPGTGGMSVAPDTPLNLPRHRRPESFDGTGKDPVFGIEESSLDQRLRFHQDSPTHGVIEPAVEMTIEEFQHLLRETARLWRPQS